MADPDFDPNIVERHVRRAWPDWTPSPELRERVRARLASSGAATIGAVGLGAALQRPNPAPWAALLRPGRLQALVGVGLLGAGFFSGYLVRAKHEPDATEAVVATVAASPASAPSGVGVSGAIPVEEPARAAPQSEPLARGAPVRREHRSAINALPARAEQTPPSSAPDDGMSGELALLQRAERATRAGNAALALAFISELAEKYPRSRFLEERRAIELLARCQADARDASAGADAFLREHPKSLYAGRVRQACQIEPAETLPEQR